MKITNLLLSPDAASGGAPGGDQTSTTAPGGDTTPPVTTPSGEGAAATPTPSTDTPDGHATVTPAPGTPPASGISKEDLATILREVIPATQPASPGQPPKQLTEAEFDQMFNVFRPKKEQLIALRRAIAENDDDAGLAVLAEVAQGASRQAATIAAYQLQNVQSQLLAHMAPALEFARAQQFQQLQTEFFGQFKDLVPYEPLVMEIAQRLQSTGYKGTKEQAFAEVSKAARAVIAKLPNGKPQSAAAPSKMSALSGGGQGGAGTAKGQPTKSKALSIWD